MYEESYEACKVDPYGDFDDIDSESELVPIPLKNEDTKTEGMAIGHTAVGYMVFL